MDSSTPPPAVANKRPTLLIAAPIVFVALCSAGLLIDRKLEVFYADMLEGEDLPGLTSLLFSYTPYVFVYLGNLAACALVFAHYLPRPRWPKLTATAFVGLVFAVVLYGLALPWLSVMQKHS